MTTPTDQSNELPIIIEQPFKLELKEKKKSIQYNIELLCDIIERDNCGIDIFYYEEGILNRDTKISFVCECGKDGIKMFRCLYKKGGGFCKDCTKSNCNKKTKKTCLSRFGVEYPTQSKVAKEKYKETCLKKYGSENTFQVQQFKEKSRKTFLEKYNVEYSSHCEIISDKIKKVI